MFLELMKISNGRREFVLGAGVEHDVVDGDVEGVFEQRRLDLVGAADQHFRALEALVHLDHFGDAAVPGCRCARARLPSAPPRPLRLPRRP
jgi:hypothetical protein